MGAGTGELWTTADLDGLTLTLTDASPAMCETLRVEAFPGAEVLRCRVDALPLQNCSFDGAVANHMLYHLDQPANAIRELHRVLRSAGWIAAATNGQRHMAELRDTANAAGVPVAAPSTERNFSMENGAALLGRYFDEIREFRYSDELDVPVGTPVFAYMASCADRPLTDGETAALRDAVDGVIRARGAFHIAKETVLFTARKR